MRHFSKLFSDDSGGFGKVTGEVKKVCAIQGISAQEVYEQKKAELRTISELILDASVRIGEFTKTLPKASGTRTDIEPHCIAEKRSETKQEITQKLGFTPLETHRFETLADNKDLVEQEKATARSRGRSKKYALFRGYRRKGCFSQQKLLFQIFKCIAGSLNSESFVAFTYSLV